MGSEDKKWTPEPWCVIRDPSHFHSLSSVIGDEDGRPVAEFTGSDVAEQEANALRAVHCVNACAHLGPDPAARIALAESLLREVGEQLSMFDAVLDGDLGARIAAFNKGAGQ